jgi:tetratricopeptide (TPR) repeat protein
VERFDEARKELDRAQELDPLSLQLSFMGGQISYFRRQYDPAIAKYRKLLEIDPNYGIAHLGLSETYFAKGEQPAAVEQWQLYMIAIGFPAVAEDAKQTFAKSGVRGALQHRISRQSNPSKLEFYYPWQVALDYARLGDKERAFFWLEKCYSERAGLAFMKVDPGLDNLRSDQRFADLVRRVGFP